MIICIKIDLALNNLQRLISHKPKQPINQPVFCNCLLHLLIVVGLANGAKKTSFVLHQGET